MMGTCCGVSACCVIKRTGLHYLKTDDAGRYLYADLRPPIGSSAGWALAGKAAPQFPSYVEPTFHPFRYLVVYHLSHILELNIASRQMLFSDSYPRMID